VYSEPGVGTTMRVYLPRVHAVADSRAAAAGTVARGGNETVLIVEDEPQVRRVAVRMLTALGYAVLEVPDAEEAIALLSQPGNSVDLVMTDVVLPKMGGLALAERIVEMRPGTRILFASGYSDDMVLRHHLLDGEMTLLQKPFTVETLAEKVREVLDRPVAAV
jgi:two-component system cell cycle sensor histidine kinase/response regulator CckA